MRVVPCFAEVMLHSFWRRGLGAGGTINMRALDRAQ